MRKISSRRWVKKGNLFVEEINMLTGEIVCKLFRNGRPTKYWTPSFVGYSS